MTTMATGGLPAGVKMQPPELFDGTMDVAVLESFFFKVERYCTLTGLVDEVKVANSVSILLTKHASIWLCSQTINWSTIEYSELKSEM